MGPSGPSRQDEKLAGFGIGNGTDSTSCRQRPSVDRGGRGGWPTTHGLGSVIPRGAPNSLIERLGQARAANATGNPGFRPDFNPGARMGFGPLITYGRRGFPGIGASGAFDPNNPQASEPAGSVRLPANEVRVGGLAGRAVACSSRAASGDLQGHVAWTLVDQVRERGRPARRGLADRRRKARSWR